MAPTINLNTLQAGNQITRDKDFWHDGFFSTMGEARSVDYAFRATVPVGYQSSPSNEGSSFSQISVAQKGFFQQALALWSDVARISFTAVNPAGYSNNATMLFANYNNPNDGAGAFAIRPGGALDPGRDWDEVQGDVWLNLGNGSQLNPSLDSLTFETIIHELGHAIGLQHPGNYNAAPNVTLTYNANAAYIQDTTQYSVMSYFDGGVNGGYTGPTADSPLLHDIAAVQRLYGINWNTRNTNTTYGFSSTAGRAIYDFNQNQAPHLAIWDGGGTDTLNLSGYVQAQRVNLHQEAFSDITPNGSAQLFNNLAIARLVDFENAIGGSGSDFITGNHLANMLNGSGGNDLLIGEDGNDTLFGGSGNDDLHGQRGNDTLFGEDGNDKLYGFEDDDDLRGGSGDDYMDGGIGNDSITASDGNDTLWGDSGNDSLAGNAGNDLLLGGRGNDTLNGGEGNDDLWGHEDTNIVFGGGGNDTFHSFADGFNTINLGIGDDRYILGAGADIITDDGGNDTLQFGTPAYADWIFGFWLNDLANDYWNPTVFERYELTGFGDRIAMRNDFLTNFTIISGAGNDTVIGGGGADSIWGDAGNDTLQGQNGNDGFDGGAGNDAVSGDAGNDALRGNTGNDSLNGGTGLDTAHFDEHFGNSSKGWNINLLLGTAKTSSEFNSNGFFSLVTETDTLANIESIFASNGTDTIQAKEGTIVSGLFFPLSRPTMDGAGGSDTLILAPTITSALSVSGYIAEDVVTYSGLNQGGVTTATLVRGTGGVLFQTATGYLDFKNIEILDTGQGNDKVSGSGFKDTVKLGIGNDTAVLGNGDDSAFGGAGLDTLTGGDGNDSLFGEGDVDTISGGNGLDNIMGGGGADKLSGGLGADKFFYVSTADGTDIISDFAVDDFFAFKGTVFGTLPVGALAATRFWTNATGVAHDADDRFIFNTTDDTLWYDNNGTAAGGAFKMADMNIAFNLTAADILVV